MRESRDIVLSPTLTVKVRDLNAADVQRAARLAKSAKIEDATAQLYTAIVAVNGESQFGATVLPVKDAFGVDALGELFDQREWRKLTNEYATAYMLMDEELEQVKNESSAIPS